MKKKRGGGGGGGGGVEYLSILAGLSLYYQQCVCAKREVGSMEVGGSDGIRSRMIEKVLVGPGQDALQPVVDIESDRAQWLGFGSE